MSVTPIMQHMQQWFASSHFSDGNAAYLEGLYEQFLNNPGTVSAEWRALFEGLPQINGTPKDISHAAIREWFRHYAHTAKAASAATTSTTENSKQWQVSQWITAYRSGAHRIANLDPLGLWQRQLSDEPSLSLTSYDLSETDKNSRFKTDVFAESSEHTLAEIEQRLKAIYGATIGYEYQHISNTEEKHWLQQRIETTEPLSFDPLRVLKLLIAADGLERYLGAKFPGAKRFSLEGGDSLLPLLDDVVQQAGSFGVQEIVIGMAHRGRLNVLVNLLGKAPAELFDEFAGKHNHHDARSGDVKYHQGFSSTIKTTHGEMHLALAFNPSHLEIVGPVVEGAVRARQERGQDVKCVPILIHGDAAFAGQGVVMETLNLSQTRGYATGGTLHIVINNQVGFTTSCIQDARSTFYCTDAAKMIDAPIFHVNADDAEAVIKVTRLALAYRMEFHKDVVIDLVCYRRHGHNEADEPTATQPLMYQVIKQHPTPRQHYAERLQAQGKLQAEQLQAFIDDYRGCLDAGHGVVELQSKAISQSRWGAYLNHAWTEPAQTGLTKEQLASLAEAITRTPEGFVFQAQVNKIVIDRKKMLAGELPLDWGCAETLAYAGLLADGYRVRISGQDCGRGTFFHRHAVWHHQQTGQTYIPLQHVVKTPGAFNIIDSTLSEEAVVAFEYGYASAEPKTLVIWEAQFGDFVNGAQVVIDQFISSGEQKWGRLCGLTLLLPHGYEGQGPEHSSARLERFLQLCAEHNMQVCVPTTPAQVFHMLRRQMIRPMRRPLIVMTPKSLLRHKLAVSSLQELSQGTFANIIDEIDELPKKGVKRVILCSGKVYYDLLEKRRALKRTDVAILRIEQLYPFPEQILKDMLAQYPKARDWVWCQEEPMNQGAWYCTQHHIQACLPERAGLLYAGRPAAAAPAVGYASLHNEQQARLVDDALGL